jgi:hypothetical protein
MSQIRRVSGIALLAVAIGLVALACHAGLGTPDSVGSPEAGNEQHAAGKSPKEVVRAFVALAEKGQIDKMVVYYRRWEQPEPRSITEETLIRAPGLEMTYRGTMLQEPVLALAKTLNAQVLDQTTKVSVRFDEIIDFGLGFICYTREKEVIRDTISKRPPILSINGERFMLPPEVMYALAPFLPGMVYKGMLAHIVTQWAPLVPYHDPNGMLGQMQQEDNKKPADTTPGSTSR